MASDSDPLIYAVVGFFGGLYLFYKGFSWFRLKRLIENIPTSKIRSLAMGLVEIYGSVVPYEKKLLKSPLLGKDCVYYSYAVKEERGSGKNRHWVTLKSGTDMVHFKVKDGTGEVLVDSKGANIEIPYDFTFSSGMGRDPPAIVKAYLKNNRLSFETFLGINKTMRYEEKLIEPSDKLYILGTAGDNPFVEEATAKKNEEDIMIQKGGNNDVYYISDRGEKDILSGLKWKSIGGIIGGALLSVICLAIILLYFGLF